MGRRDGVSVSEGEIQRVPAMAKAKVCLLSTGRCSTRAAGV